MTHDDRTPGSGWHGVASHVRPGLAVAGAAAVVLPAMDVVGSPIHGTVAQSALALALALGALFAARRLAAPTSAAAVAGLAGVCLGSWLAGEASYPWSAWAVAIFVGMSAGLLGRAARHGAAETGFALAAAAAVVAAHAIAGPGIAAITTMLVAAAAFAAQLPGRRPATAAGWHTWPILAGMGLYGLFALSWVGATAPRVEWFGRLTSHGPHDRAEVAITFDDGPNAPYTNQIAAILERYGARGTFFEVGKAVRQQPEVTRTLIEHGHVVGNHSYHHDAVSFLDPRYTELDQAEEVFRDQAGTCPALFRPPHGTHTPFMSRIVQNAGMRLVTWDVSARDWVETDPARLAANVLARARPGSIILLHDGIDGTVGADRSVVVQALPAILEGLAARGLRPVTLDKLLGVPAYLQTCE